MDKPSFARSDKERLEARARRLYNECPTVKPKWEQLGAVTQGVWVDRAKQDEQRELEDMLR